MKYASGTSVAPDRSRAEIEKILTRYGATRFASGWDQSNATLAFEAHGKRVRFVLTMPRTEEFLRTPKGQRRTPKAAETVAKQEEKRRWRALALVVKAKLEAVESKVSTFDDEFLAFFIMPNGQTIGQQLMPSLEKSLRSGKLPPLLTP